MARLIDFAAAAVLLWFAWQAGVELFVAWYSGVEPEPTTAQRRWLTARLLCCLAGAVVLLWPVAGAARAV